MNSESMAWPARPGPALATIDVTLTVTRFQNLLEPGAAAAPLCDFEMKGPDDGNGRLKVGDFQKGSPAGARHTLRVQRPGVMLRFTIEPGPEGERYLPVGISFERADRTLPMAVPWSSDARAPAGSPFSGLTIEGPTIRVLDQPIGGVLANGEVTPPRRVTYKFSVFVQRQRDGALGVIDPGIENEN